MPILPSEPDHFPPGVLELPADDATWWAMYTMARREKELMRRLTALEIGFYAPVVPKRTRSPNGRTRVSHVPLFPSYVFVRGSDEQRQRVLTTNCVSRSLPIPDTAGLLRDLRQIRQLIALDTPLTIESKIEPGQRIRVRSGPMSGLEGTVAKRRGREWLVVAVEFLGQGASVLLEDFQVEPL